MRNPLNKAANNRTAGTAPGKDNTMNDVFKKVAAAAATIGSSTPQLREEYVKGIEAAIDDQAKAREAKEEAVSATASETEKTIFEIAGFSSSIRERKIRLLVRSESLSVCFLISSVHSFSPFSISSTSASADMIERGAFISCPASVMNWRCFS